MKAFIASLAALVIIAGGAAIVLNSIDRSAEHVYSSGNVRF